MKNPLKNSKLCTFKLKKKQPIQSFNLSPQIRLHTDSEKLINVSRIFFVHKTSIALRYLWIKCLVAKKN